MSTSNAEVFDRVAGAYTDQLKLQAPELSILGRLAERLPGADVLDLGIGAGRTTRVLAPAARTYVGIDYAPAMVDAARRVVGEDASTELAVGDARDLSRFGDGSFDFVLFSFNGIDYVKPEERPGVLGEMRRVLSPDGWMAFSTHSLLAMPFEPRVARPSLRRPLGSTWRALLSARTAMRLRRENRRVARARAVTRGWALVRDAAHEFSLLTCYVTPAFQVAQLAETGFELADVYDLEGRRVDPARPGCDPWLYYLCRPASAASTRPRTASA